MYLNNSNYWYSYQFNLYVIYSWTQWRLFWWSAQKNEPLYQRQLPVMLTDDDGTEHRAWFEYHPRAISLSHILITAERTGLDSITLVWIRRANPNGRDANWQKNERTEHSNGLQTAYRSRYAGWKCTCYFSELVMCDVRFLVCFFLLHRFFYHIIE